MIKVSAIIPAAGAGKRFSAKQKKQFFLLNEKSVLYYTLYNLKRSYDFKEFIIGVASEDVKKVEEIFSELEIENFILAEGGTERFDTVYNCLRVATGDYILIHDAVRPFVNKEIVRNCILKGINTGATICGIKPNDTVKSVSEDKISETIDRNSLLLVHTPQVFKKSLLISAIEFQRKNNLFITDEAMAVEALGKDVHFVESDSENIKLTKADDLELFEFLLKKTLK